MAKVAASDQDSRILIFWLMAKCIIWESNLVASAARGLILMNLNQEGCLRGMH
jgi:hypothetical protein